MRVLRAIAVTVILVAAAAGIWWASVRPVVCDWRTLRALRLASRATESDDAGRSARYAREALAFAIPCLTCEPYDVQTRLIAAHVLELLGRDAQALSVAAEAARWDRRPELFIRLATLEHRTGDVENARRHVREAVLFNPRFLGTIEDGVLRSIAERETSGYFASRGNLIRNGTFEQSRPGGAVSMTSPGGGPPSSAAAWTLYSAGPGTLECRLAPSTRGAGPRQMLHVRAAAPLSGVFQVWAPRDRGPSQVVTAAWVYVVRGGAAVGSGRVAEVSPDAVSTVVGAWQRIEGRSQSCPVNQTQIFATAPDSEFYVAEVTVSADPDAPPCLRVDR